MKKNLLFFDTYALIETFHKNESYEDYLSCYPIITQLNLFEICYYALRKGLDVQQFLTLYSPFVIAYNEKVIEQAARMRFHYKKRGLSMADCVGYVVAQMHGIPFLTGDKQFADFPNVKYVK